MFLRPGRSGLVLLKVLLQMSTMPPETYSNDFGGFGNSKADSNSNFVVSNFFFEGFEIVVCSCECAVACLCPRNSISNVVASVTIDANM